MGQVRILAIPVDRTEAPEVRTINADLDGLREQVGGGWIEAVSGSGFTLYCDEEGKLKGLPVNDRATRLIMALWPNFRDVIVGPAFLTGTADGRGNDTDVVPSVVAVADRLWGTSLSA